MTIKPAEPMHLGAVIVDRNGHTWTRTHRDPSVIPGGHRPWTIEIDVGFDKDYDDIDVVKVLHGGWVDVPWTLSPDERHAVAGELRWLADHRENGAVLSPDWLRKRAVWVETSGERRAPARANDLAHTVSRRHAFALWCRQNQSLPQSEPADALDSIVLRWGELDGEPPPPPSPPPSRPTHTFAHDGCPGPHTCQSGCVGRCTS